MSPSNFPGIGSADEGAWFDDEKNNDFLVWKKASREKDEHWLDLKTIVVQVSGMDDVKSFEDFVRQWMQQRNIYEEYAGMKRVPNPKKEELAANITNDLIQELRQKDNRTRPAKFQSWLQKGVKHYLPRDIYLIKKRGRVRRIRQSLKVEKTQDSSAEPGALQSESYAEPEGSSPSSLPGTPPPGALPTRTRRARKAVDQVPSTPAEPIESPMRTLRTSAAQTQIYPPLSEGPHIGSSMTQGHLSSSAANASSLTMVGIRGFEIELEVRVRGQSLLEPPIETTSFAAEMLIKHEYLAELTPLQYRNDHLSFAVFKAAIAQPPTYFNDLEDELGWISADRGFTIINDEWHFQNALGVLRNQGLGRLQLHLRKPAKAFRVIPSRGPLNISWIQSNTRPHATRLAAPVAPMAASVASPIVSPVASPAAAPVAASNDTSASVPAAGKRLRKQRESEPRGGEKRRRTGRSSHGQAEERDTEPK